MNTKLFLFAVLCTIFGVNLFSQNKTTITWGQTAKFDINDASYVNKALAYVDNIYYCTKEIKNADAVFVNPTLGIVKYDKSFNIVAANNIEAQKDKKKLNVVYIGCLKDNKIYSIQTYQNDSKGLCSVFACTINPKTLVPNNDLVKVMDIAAKGDYFNLNSFSSNPFQITESEDKSKFVVAAMNDSAVGLEAEAVVMNAELVKVREYTVAIKDEISLKRFKLKKAVLSNNGELLFGGIETGKKSAFSNNTPTENRILLVNCIKKEASYSFQDLATKDKGMGSFNIGVLPNGNFIFFCFTQNKDYSEGYLYQEISIKTGEIEKESRYTFNSEDLKAYWDKLDFDKIKSEKDRNKPIGIIKAMEVRDFYIDSENDVWIISEHYDPPSVQGNSYTSASYGYIYVIKISNTKLKWTATIPKIGSAAWGTLDIGYILNKGNDVLDFVYYEEEINFPNNTPQSYKDEEIDLDYQTVAMKLTKDGKVSKQLLIAPERGREILFLSTNTFIKTGPNQGVCMGLAHFGFRNDKKYHKLGFLKF